MDTNQSSDKARPMPVDGAVLGNNAVHEAYHLMRQQSAQTSDSKLFAGVDETVKDLINLASNPEANKDIDNILSTNGHHTDSRRNDVLFALYTQNKEAFRQWQAKEPEAFERFAETSLRDLTEKLRTGKNSTNREGDSSKSAKSLEALVCTNPYGKNPKNGKWDSASDTITGTVLEDSASDTITGTVLENSTSDTITGTVLENSTNELSHEVSHVQEPKGPSTEVPVPKPEAPVNTAADNTNTDRPIVDSPPLDNQTDISAPNLESPQKTEIDKLFREIHESYDRVQAELDKQVSSAAQLVGSMVKAGELSKDDKAALQRALRYGLLTESEKFIERVNGHLKEMHPPCQLNVGNEELQRRFGGKVYDSYRPVFINDENGNRVDAIDVPLIEIRL